MRMSLDLYPACYPFCYCPSGGELGEGGTGEELGGGQAKNWGEDGTGEELGRMVQARSLKVEPFCAGTFCFLFCDPTTGRT